MNVGQQISHYEIVEKIGEGGMGRVYAALDTTLGRKVALKVLPARLASEPEFLERFEREAKAVAALNHPHIVTIHTVEEADGHRFFTMELVEGQPLGELIPRGGMTLGRLIELGSQVADALSAAHEHGIVHRDLKPSNVMVTADGRVKILDFGLAKVAGASLPDERSQAQTDLFTQTGAVLGTAPYMSPEQIKGQPLDHRTDIFSLGVILYEMATGTRPFAGDSAADLVSSILRDAPGAVSEINVDLPRQLGRIVDHCLAKDVDRRYQTAKDVRNELQELKREISTLEIRLGFEKRPRRSARALARRALPVLAIAAVAVSLVLAGRSCPVRPASTFAVAVLPFDNLTGDSGQDYIAAGVGAGLVTELGELAGLHVVSRAESRAAREKSAAPAEIARRLGVNALVEGEIQRDADRLLVGVRVSDAGTGRVLWSESFADRPTELFGLQKRIARKLAAVFSIPLSGRERRRLARDPTRSFEAYDFYLRGRERLELDTADGSFEAAELFRQAVRVDPGFALAHVGLGDALWAEHELHRRPEALAAAEEAARRALELDPDLPAALVLQARIHRSSGRSQDSIREIERVLDRHPKPTEAQRELAWAYERAGRMEDAERSLRGATAVAGDDWYSWNSLGMFLARRGRYEDARQVFERAAALAPPGVFLPQENLATADLSLGRFSEAVAAFERLPQEIVAARPRLASNVGTAYYFSDRPRRLERAAEYYRLAIELRPNYGLYHRNLADVYLELGRAEEAKAEYREALRLVDAELAGDPDNPRLLLERALYAARSDACAEALPLAARLGETPAASGRTLHQVASVFALCGDADAALAALTGAIELGEPPVKLLQEPEFESLRGEPGFVRLLQAHGVAL